MNRMSARIILPMAASLLMALSLLGIGGSARAALPFAATPEEYATLPPYCLAKAQGNYSYWQTYFGHGNAEHMHHFCDCLRFQSRAMRYPADKNFYLHNAIEGCEYVLTHANPDFFMRPQIYTEEARALMSAGQDVQAVVQLTKAIEADKRYAPAYLQMIEYFVLKNQRAKALEYATEGLKNVPESKALKRRYDELGGKKPYPEPYPQPETKKPEEETEARKNLDKPAPGDSPDLDQSSPADRSAGPSTPASGTAAPPSGRRSGNPWCRFCPDDDGAQADLPASDPIGKTKPTAETGK